MDHRRRRPDQGLTTSGCLPDPTVVTLSERLRYNPHMRGYLVTNGVVRQSRRDVQRENVSLSSSAKAGIREGAAHYAPQLSDGRGSWESEKHLCDAWASGGLNARNRKLRTLAGASVEVIHTGGRNSGDGPDFLDAVIAIASPGQPPRIVSGDVEMHLRAPDWFAHGHDANPAFASVILHVVEDACGLTEIAGAPLLEFLPPPHRRGTRKNAGAQRGRGIRGGRNLAALLDSLGDARLEERAAAMEGDIAVVGSEQALYEALFRGLGYTRNMTAFQEVARLLPIEALRGLTQGAPNEESRIARLTGLLFGAAGLLPSQRGRAAQGRLSFDELPLSSVDGYTAAAEAEWARHPGLESLPRGSWQTFRVRPDNHPIRRTGVAAEMMRSWLTGPELPETLRRIVIEGVTPRETATRLIETLTIPPVGYWASHRDFGLARRGEPSALLGRGRALDMLATAVLPFLLAMADLNSDIELERRTREVYAVLPNPGESDAARRARRLLAGNEGEATTRLSARRYQGFLSWASANSLGAARESLPLFAE